MTKEKNLSINNRNCNILKLFPITDASEQVERLRLHQIHCCLKIASFPGEVCNVSDTPVGGEFGGLVASRC